MITFKQFLLEGDPLNDLAVEMWLRNRFGISQKQASETVELLHQFGKTHPDSIYFEDDALFHKLLSLLGDNIPQYVLDDGQADFWLVQKIYHKLVDDGFEII